MRSAALIGALSLSAVTVLSGRQVFRSGVDTVHLPVIVSNRDGSPMGGLVADDFEIRENGRLQTIVALHEGDGLLGPGGGGVPLHLGILLDRSTSMEGEFEAAAAAAIAFVNALDAARDVTLVEFDTHVRLARFAPSDYLQLFARIREKRWGLMTAFYDALAVYIDAARTRAGQHLLVIYSDGQDSSSRTNLTALLRLLQQGNVIVYAVGYLEQLSPSERFRARHTLTSIAAETGGAAYFPASGREIDRIYTRIRTETASRYTIGYVPADGRRDGRFRKIEVRLKPPKDAGARVRTRSGYLPLAERSP